MLKSKVCAVYPAFCKQPLSMAGPAGGYCKSKTGRATINISKGLVYDIVYLKQTNQPSFYNGWCLILIQKEIDQVVINTDARSLLEQHGLPNSDRILIRDRKPEICGDDVSMNLVLADDVISTEAGLYIMTHTTNPFLRSETIRQAISEFLESQNDSLFTVNKLQTRFYNSDCVPINHDPNKLERTQDLEPYFEENSCLYIFTKEGFLKNGNRIGVNPIMKEISRVESIDIDNMEDWNLAEIIAKKK